jgi:hypothetical protein
VDRLSNASLALARQRGGVSGLVLWIATVGDDVVAAVNNITFNTTNGVSLSVNVRMSWGSVCVWML